mgnify:FL=1
MAFDSSPERPEGPRNVFGEPLADCSHQPKTGFFRDGCCRGDARDPGRHVVCVRVTDTFLTYSASRGNDLSTPRPEFRFPGLKPGDQWCLCAARWQEALQAGCAPRVVLAATDRLALQTCQPADLQKHAADLP